MSGGLVQLNAGGMREPHWHSPNEWAYVLNGLAGRPWSTKAAHILSNHVRTSGACKQKLIWIGKIILAVLLLISTKAKLGIMTLSVSTYQPVCIEYVLAKCSSAA